MTQLALLKRKINYADDKQSLRGIICSYIDKGGERLELSHTEYLAPAPPLHSHQSHQPHLAEILGTVLKFVCYPDTGPLRL